MTQRAHVLIAIVICGLMTEILAAQSSPSPATDRRETNQPILLVDSESPNSNVYALQFVKDGAKGMRLFAGGEGKVIWQWQVRDDEISKTIRLDPLPRIRWPIDRGFRGMISSMATKPSLMGGSSFLAFGGFGVIPADVQVRSLDREDSVATFHSTHLPSIQNGVFSLEFWPEPSKLFAVGCGSADPNQALVVIWNQAQNESPCGSLETGFNDVPFLRVSPNGRALVAADRASKRVRRWVIRETEPFRADAPVDFQMPSPVVGLEWTDDSRCIVATQSNGLVPLDGNFSEKNDAAAVRLLLRNRTSRTVTLATRSNGRNVNTWEVAPERSRVVTTSPVQQLALRDAMNEWQTTDLDLRASPHWELEFQPDSKERPRIMAFAGTSLFAASPGITVALKSSINFDPARPEFGKVRRIIDVSPVDPERPLLARLQEPQFDGPVTALAVSSDGRFVAAAGEQTRPTLGQFGQQPIPEVRLWRVTDGALVAVTPDREAVQPSLSPIRRVSLARTRPQSTVPDVVRFSWSNNSRATLSLPDTLKDQAISVSGNSTDEPPSSDEVQAWGLRLENDRFWLTSQAAKQEDAGPFPHLDWFSRDIWLAHRFTRQKKEYMAIGYRAGILIWDLARLRQLSQNSPRLQEQALVRCFYGHTGRLSGISVSEDGAYLVTGSEDGSICLWSLSGIEQPYDGTRELGLTLRREASGVQVDQVVLGLPTYFAGLQPNDELEKVQLPRPGRPESEWFVPQDKWEGALKAVPPGLEARFQMRGRPGWLIAGLFHEPLWTLYPMLDGQWVMVTPSQLFGASSDEAMRRFGWHVNMGRGKENRVAFFPLDLFRESYDNVVPIVQTSWKEQRPAVRSSSFELPTVVEIQEIHAEISGQKQAITELARPTDFEVDLSVQPSGRETPQQLELWCNGYLVQKTQLQSNVTGAASKFSWLVEKSLLRIGDQNMLIAIVRSSSEGRSGSPPLKLVNRAIRTITVAGTATPKIHFLGIGVTDLKHAADFGQSRESLKPLQFAANDVCLLGYSLAERARASGLEIGKFRYLVARVPEGLTIDENQVAVPTHSEILKSLDELREIAAPNDFVCVSISCHGFGEQDGAHLVAHDTSPNLENAVSDRELFAERLWRLKSPSLVLLDACHSGSSLTGDSLRGLNGFGLGPEILVSCKPQQQSFETQHMHRIAERWFGMSLFTASLVEALTGQELTGTETASQQMKSIVYRPQIDRNGDGFLSVEELGLHATRRVPTLKLLTKKVAATTEVMQQPDLLPSLAFPRQKIRLRVPVSR